MAEKKKRHKNERKRYRYACTKDMEIVPSLLEPDALPASMLVQPAPSFSLSFPALEEVKGTKNMLNRDATDSAPRPSNRRIVL